MSPDHYSPWVQAGQDHTAGSLLSPSTHLPLVSVLLFLLSLSFLSFSPSLSLVLLHTGWQVALGMWALTSDLLQGDLSKVT